MVDLRGSSFDGMKRMIMAKLARDVGVVVIELNLRFELFLRGAFSFV